MKKLYLAMAILLNISCYGVAQSQQYLSQLEQEQVYEENLNRCMDQSEYKQQMFMINAYFTPLDYCKDKADEAVQTILAKEYGYW
jgi:hypothetical protein